MSVTSLLSLSFDVQVLIMSSSSPIHFELEFCEIALFGFAWTELLRVRLEDSFVATESVVLFDEMLAEEGDDGLKSIGSERCIGWSGKENASTDPLSEVIWTIGDGWAVYQQDLSSEKTPEGLSLYAEVAESGNLFVVNLFEFVSYIKFEGFMDSAVQIIEYDHKGNVIREMPFRKNGDGIVEFLAHPGVSYEIVRE